MGAISLYRLIDRAAVRGAELQDADGSMPAGRNGPYGDAETPVRNTSHWLITFTSAARRGGDDRIRSAAASAADYLMGPAARPMGGAFWHRQNPRKDSCNGLIGQAWTIEALAEAGSGLDRQDLSELAEEVFLMHPFDADAALWRCVAADRCYLDFDLTFNHQLWFAAAGALLAPAAGPEVGTRVRRFMDRLEGNMALYRSGLIKHPLRVRLPGRSRVRYWISRYRESRIEPHLRNKAVGYHAFNLYALALLHRWLPDHGFWRSSAFGAAWRYVRSPTFARRIEGNRYGFGYNPPGYEVPLALEVFEGPETRAAQAQWLKRQLQHSLDPASGLPTEGSADPATHLARLYEATRLPDLSVELPAIERTGAGVG